MCSTHFFFFFLLLFSHALHLMFIAKHAKPQASQKRMSSISRTLQRIRSGNVGESKHRPGTRRVNNYGTERKHLLEVHPCRHNYVFEECEKKKNPFGFVAEQRDPDSHWRIGFQCLDFNKPIFQSLHDKQCHNVGSADAAKIARVRNTQMQQQIDRLQRSLTNLPPGVRDAIAQHEPDESFNNDHTHRYSFRKREMPV